MLFSRAQVQQLLNNLLELGPRRLMALGLIGFAVLVTVVGGAYYLSRPEFETLYTGLSREDVTRCLVDRDVVLTGVNPTLIPREQHAAKKRVERHERTA